MPSKSKAQRNLMAAAAHNPAFAKKVGIPTSVAKEFNAADKGKKFAKGGDTMAKKLFGGKETYKEELAEAKAIKSGKITPEQYAKGEKAEGVHKMKRGGMTAGKAAHAQKEGKRVAKEMEYDYKTGKKSFAGSTAKKDAHAEKEGRKVAKAMEYDYSKGRPFKKGGSIDGIAVRGKTRCNEVKMCGGGMAKKGK